MRKYYTPGVYFVSIVSGILAFVITLIFTDPLVALLCGAAVTLLVSVAIPLGLSMSDGKYKRFKEGIPRPFIIDERVNCVIGGELKGGFIVLTRDKLFIMTFVGKRPIRYELKRDEVKKVSVSENIYLNIFLDYNKFIRIASGNCLEIKDKLSEQGFGD